MKKAIPVVLILLLLFVVVATYLLFQPHRDVTNSAVDHHMHVDELVDEYLKDRKTANAKYLAADGDSKIIAQLQSARLVRNESIRPVLDQESVAMFSVNRAAGPRRRFKDIHMDVLMLLN